MCGHDRRPSGHGYDGRSAADTLLGALSQAYQVNPQLNAQRAIVRQADEAVPQALLGYRPSVKVNAGAGKQITSQDTIVGPGLVQKYRWPTTPSSVGITVQQTLFNGFRADNQTRAAESSVFAARETLRVIEQTVLLDAATVYMDVVRDAAILEVQRSNVRVSAKYCSRHVLASNSTRSRVPTSPRRRRSSPPANRRCSAPTST